MLQRLYVKNLALIDEIEVELKDGLNILTGETGAGKSIILGSVNLALGARYSKDMLRKGAEYGFVELNSLQTSDGRQKCKPDQWRDCDDDTFKRSGIGADRHSRTARASVTSLQEESSGNCGCICQG